MSSPHSTTLRQLRHLDESSPNFHDQLTSVLSGEKYEQSVPNLQNNDLVFLVDYLDKVRRHVALPTLRLSQYRPLIFSIPQVPDSRNVYASLEKYVAPGRYCRPPTLFRLQSLISVITLLPRGVQVMYTMGSTTA